MQRGEPGPADAGQSTRRRLIETAERLIAERGPDVSLRQISVSAGLYNNFAVQYHFGSKDGLLDAISDHRLPAIDAMREELLAEATAQAGKPDARALVEVLLRPLAAEAQDPDSHFVSFLVRARLQQMQQQPWFRPGARSSGLGRDVALSLMEQLHGVPEALRLRRLDIALGSCLFALAAYESGALGPQPVTPAQESPDALPFEVFVTDLFDGVASSLLRLPSPTVRAALAPADQ